MERGDEMKTDWFSASCACLHYLVFWKSWNDVLIFEPWIRFRTTPFSSGSEVKQPPVGNKLIYVFFSSYYIMNIIIINIIMMSIIIIIIIIICYYYY